MLSFFKVQSEKQISEIAKLAREIWSEHYEPIIGRGQVDYMLEHFQSPGAVRDQMAGEHDYYLVQSDGQSAGYLAVVPEQDKQTLKLSKIYLRKAERGRGLGRDMMRFVEQLALNRGLKQIRLTVNKKNSDSIAWYFKQGFTNVKPIVQDIGGGFVMDDFVLEKRLAE